MKKNKEKYNQTVTAKDLTAGIYTRHNPAVTAKDLTAGITLIALVITIIVLIILSSVSINVLVGNNGIIQRAKSASNMFKISSVKESINIYLLEAYEKEKNITPEEIFNKLKENNVIDDSAKLEGSWVNVFNTRISTLNPYKEAVMLTSEESGFEIGLNINTNRYRINRYNGDDKKEIIIPDYIDGCLIEEIGGTILSGSTILESVVLPENLKIIDGYSFNNNTSLKTVIFSEMLEEIGNGVFQNCTNLSVIEIPDSVVKIGKGSFQNCSNIKKVVLSQNIKTIGDYAFFQLSKVEEPLYIPSSISSIGKQAFLNFGKENNTAIYFNSYGVTIGNLAFTGCNVKEYIVPQQKPTLRADVTSNVSNLMNLNKKYVFLTFDDAPSYDSMTNNILDILKENNIKATFFMIGTMIEDYKMTAQRIYNEGHYCANHAYSNDDAELYSSAQSVINEYNKTENLLKELSGNKNYNSRLFRFPGGSTGQYSSIKQEAITLLQQQNIAYLDWNVDINDAVKKGDGTRYTEDEMYERFLSTVQEDKVNVVLMHSFSEKTNTDKVLERVIQYYKDNGFEFKSGYDLNDILQ